MAKEYSSENIITNPQKKYFHINALHIERVLKTGTECALVREYALDGDSKSKVYDGLLKLLTLEGQWVLDPLCKQGIERMYYYSKLNPCRHYNIPCS